MIMISTALALAGYEGRTKLCSSAPCALRRLDRTADLVGIFLSPRDGVGANVVDKPVAGASGRGLPSRCFIPATRRYLTAP